MQSIVYLLLSSESKRFFVSITHRYMHIRWTEMSLFWSFVWFIYFVCACVCSADYDKYSEDPEFKPASRHKDLFDEV